MISCCALTLAALLPARAPPRTAAVRACALPTAEFSRPHRIDPKRKYERAIGEDARAPGARGTAASSGGGAAVPAAFAEPSARPAPAAPPVMGAVRDDDPMMASIAPRAGRAA